MKQPMYVAVVLLANMQKKVLDFQSFQLTKSMNIDMKTTLTLNGSDVYVSFCNSKQK